MANVFSRNTLHVRRALERLAPTWAVTVVLLLMTATTFAQRPNIQWMRGGFEYTGDGSPTPFYSSDGQYLLAYGFAGASVKIFDVSSGLLLQTIIPGFQSDGVWA